MMTDQCPMRLSPIFSSVKLGQEESLLALLYYHDDRSVSYEIDPIFSWVKLGQE